MRWQPQLPLLAVAHRACSHGAPTAARAGTRAASTRAVTMCQTHKANRCTDHEAPTARTPTRQRTKGKESSQVLNASRRQECSAADVVATASIHPARDGVSERRTDGRTHLHRLDGLRVVLHLREHRGHHAVAQRVSRVRLRRRLHCSAVGATISDNVRLLCNVQQPSGVASEQRSMVAQYTCNGRAAAQLTVW